MNLTKILEWLWYYEHECHVAIGANLVVLSAKNKTVKIRKFPLLFQCAST